MDGFKNGFDLGYRGPQEIQQKSANLKFTIGDKKELWNKVMKEVQLKRYAGPFKQIPYNNYIQSPIGLVPKDGGKKTRLIFHLSHPRDPEKGISINRATPEELKTVNYVKFDDAIRLCLKAGKGCFAGKSDLSSAFRHLGMKKCFWKFLVMKAQNPDNNNWYYFIDKCMPFGAAISCANFQAFSDALSHIVEYKMKQENINYLDDFFFADLAKLMCNKQIQCFIDICNSINFPVALEKTEWARTRITFLGLLIDTILQKIFIPVSKVSRALQEINFILTKKNKKIRQKRLEKLTGFLNFLGKSIVPGRAFTRRLYSHINPKLKSHHHIKVTEEMRLDLELWQGFLNNQDIYCRDFMEFDTNYSAQEISMFSDASANHSLGCGGYSESEYYILQWDEQFMKTANPSINYLELYGVTVAVLLWIHKYKNKFITLFCDNMSVVQMINNNSSKCRNCMVLIRLLVLEGLKQNVKISAKHVKGKLNTISDMLSRLKYREFRAFTRKNNLYFKGKPSAVPEILWPMDNLWIYDDQI